MTVGVEYCAASSYVNDASAARRGRPARYTRCSWSLVAETDSDSSREAGPTRRMYGACSLLTDCDNCQVTADVRCRDTGTFRTPLLFSVSYRIQFKLCCLVHAIHYGRSPALSDGNGPVSRRQQITFRATLIFHLVDRLVLPILVNKRCI